MKRMRTDTHFRRDEIHQCNIDQDAGRHRVKHAIDEQRRHRFGIVCVRVNADTDADADGSGHREEDDHGDGGEQRHSFDTSDLGTESHAFEELMEAQRNQKNDERLRRDSQSHANENGVQGNAELE